MTKPIGRDTIYRCRRFSPEAIELCVRWYITYRLSYRDLAAMMAEREIAVSTLRSCAGCCAMRAVGLSVGAFASAATRLVKKRRLANVRHGFYLILRPEDRAAGAPDPEHWIDPLMKYQAVGPVGSIPFRVARRYSREEFRMEALD